MGAEDLFKQAVPLFRAGTLKRFNVATRGTKDFVKVGDTHFGSAVVDETFGIPLKKVMTKGK